MSGDKWKPDRSGPAVAAIYCRVSSVQQEENANLPTQEEACRAYCELHGYVIPEGQSYRETHSGADLWGRPALTRLRAAMRAGEIDVIVAYAVDRLSRDQHHLGLVVSEAEHHGVRLEFVTERLDDTPAGRFLQSALSFVAEVEREKFKERSRRGKQSRIQSGKPLHGRRPLYGYTWINDDSDPEHVRKKVGYAVCEPEAAVIQRIFHDMANGATLRSIARALTAEGIMPPSPRRSGQPIWQTSTVQRICKQPAYWGEAEAYRYRVVPTRVVDAFTGETRIIKRRLERPPEERVSVAHTVPAIVDRELALSVTARLERNRMEATRNNQAPYMTLLRGGFAKCGYCGVNMVAKRSSGGGKGIGYFCGSKNHDIPGCGWHSVRAAVLDHAVWERVTSLLTQPEIIAREVERRRTEDPTTANVAAVDHALADITKRQANLARVAAQVPDADAVEPIVAQLSMLAQSRRRLEAERDQILAQRDAWQAAQHRLDDLRAWCETVASRLDTLTYEQKREALYALGVRVLVYRRDHDPHYRIEANIPLNGTPASLAVMSVTKTD